jgi:ATP-dependent helicase HrpA
MAPEIPTVDALRAQAAAARVGDALWAEPKLRQAAQRLARGQATDRTLGEVAARLAAGAAEVQRRSALPLTITYPEQLPVAARRDEILAEIARSPVVVLTGATGSGKTTQLPKMLLEAGYGRRGMIALTQPRRVAAVAMAARIREELAAAEGVVAHSVRFDDRAGADTLVRVVTDGLLLAEFANDPELSRYDAVIVDEAHERNLNVDLLLGLLRLLRERRPELLVVIASASIEAERFSAYFARVLPDSAHVPPPVPIIAVEGRTFPVEIRYQPPGDDDIGYLGAALQAIRDVHGDRESGDVLCFLPTERDIIEAGRRLDDLAGATVLPLFSRLTPKEQQRVFQPARGRKIVLTTNIAETSLTITGIRYVIDTGLARIKRYQAGSRTERLPVEAISQASCTQRAGRAGRVTAGVCIRLFPEEDFTARDPYTTPEILRSNLAGVLLQCLGMGLGQPEAFPWLDAPAGHAWHQAWGLLDELGALAETVRSAECGARSADVRTAKHQPALPVAGQQGTIGGQRSGGDAVPAPATPGEAHSALRTPHSAPRDSLSTLSPMGRQLASIPADPQVARILLAGLAEGVPHEACTIAAFLSVQDPRVRPLGSESKADSAHKALAHEAGDLATVLRLWDRYQDAASASARKRFCESGFIGFRRMREWADVRHQLWQAVRERRGGAAGAGLAAGAPVPATGHPSEAWPLDRVHRAVLAGMLGNVLMYDPELRVFRGAGDRQLHVHPGSALRAGKVDDGKRAPPPPPWLVACEVVETSRLFARLCAPIDPEWVVELAGARVRRRHRDPHWHAKRRQVVCTETVTWKGLPVRSGRLVPYERIDPRDATAVFVREGLCGEHLDGEFPVIARNRAVLADARRLRDRLRDPTLWIDDAQIAAFYRERLGLDAADAPVIASSDALRRWCRTHGEERLAIAAADLADPEAVARAAAGFPEEVAMGGQRLALRYRFVPGDADDGVTLELREDQLALVDQGRLDWLVPGALPETIEAYLGQLPKDLRRRLIPLADSARELTERCLALPDAATRRGLPQVLAELLREHLGQPCPPFTAGALPAHLRLRFRIRGVDGTLAYEGRDPEFLAAQAAAAGDRLRVLRGMWETPPATSWPGDCPGEVAAGGVTGHVALMRCRDERGLVAARRTVFASALAAQAWHEDGLDALLEAACDADLAAVALAPAPLVLATRVERLFGARCGALRRGCALCVVRSVERGRIRDAEAFADLQARAQAALATAAREIDGLLERICARAEPLRARLKQGAKSLAAAAAIASAAEQVARLSSPDLPARLPWHALRRADVYLEALGRRLDLAATRPQDTKRAADRCAGLLALWEDALPADAARLIQALGCAAQVRELGGVLEECLLALGDPAGLARGAASGAGFAEGRLRSGLLEVSKRVAGERDAIADARTRLLEHRVLVARIGGPARTRLGEECERLLAAFPDLGLGADLPAQRQAVVALCERIRAASGSGLPDAGGQAGAPVRRG